VKDREQHPDYRIERYLTAAQACGIAPREQLKATKMLVRGADRHREPTREKVDAGAARAHST
jgi:hypothetical protein